jgi:hypothetical protein
MVLAENAPQASTCTTVLFIDDNEDDLQYWCEALKKYSSHNYTVLDASSAELVSNFADPKGLIVWS